MEPIYCYDCKAEKPLLYSVPLPGTITSIAVCKECAALRGHTIKEAGDEHPREET